MTAAEFLAWDGGGHQGKLELVDGEVRAMAPASATHGAIQANLAYLLKRHLDERGGGCRAVTEPAVAVRIRAIENTRVPDVGVTCAPDMRGEQLLPEPILLIEVLSPGNSYETWDNIWSYVTIPTLQEILVVHSTAVKAELLRKGADGAWPENAKIIAAGGAIPLASIGAELAMGEVYKGTYLERDS